MFIFGLLRGTSEMFNSDFIVHQLHIKQFTEDVINVNANKEHLLFGGLLAEAM